MVNLSGQTCASVMSNKVEAPWNQLLEDPGHLSGQVGAESASFGYFRTLPFP